MFDGLNELTVHADELAEALFQGELGGDGGSRILRSTDEDIMALNAAGIKTPDWERFKSR